MRFIISSIFLASCSLLNSNILEGNYVESVWKIIEHSSSQSWSKDDVIRSLGKPEEKYIHKNKLISWFYFQKKSGLQEWAFTFNKNNVDSTLYIPKDPFRSEFTIEKIMARWKNLDCTHKTRQELSPGLIKAITYLDCDSGHRIITYNIYKEVESILIDY